MSTCVCLPTKVSKPKSPAYTYSDEYLNNFGIDSVPYARTQTSVDGESTVAYQRNQAMDPGFAGFDADQASVLQVSLASNSNPTRGSGHQKVVGGGNRFTILWTSTRSTGCRASLCPALGGELRLPVPHHSEHPGSGREHSFYCERLILVLIRPLRPDQSVMIGA